MIGKAEDYEREQQQNEDLESSIATKASLYGHDNRHLELGVALKYNLSDRFYAKIAAETGIVLFDKDGIKDHYENYTLGLGAGYRIVKYTRLGIDADVSGGLSLKNSPWKYFYYDGSVNFWFRQGIIKPTFGFGVRYYDSRNDNFDNHLRFYVSIGFALSF